MVRWQLVGSPDFHEVALEENESCPRSAVQAAVQEWSGLQSKWVEVSMQGKILPKGASVSPGAVLREYICLCVHVSFQSPLDTRADKSSGDYAGVSTC